MGTVSNTNPRPAGTGHAPRLRRNALLAVASIAQFMVVLDVTIINVALPEMRTARHMSAGGQQWVINAYTLTFAGFLMLGGRAADLFGRRRVFLAGLTVFTLFSLLGGLAQTGGELIAARAAQGVGGAILAPATLSLLTAEFTEHHERRRALRDPPEREVDRHRRGVVEVAQELRAVRVELRDDVRHPVAHRADHRPGAGLDHPRWIEVRGELPMTATGKVQRFKLREEDAAAGSG